MAKLLKLRIGVADDPTALQPKLHDCLEAVLQQADRLWGDVIEGLVIASASTGPRRVAAFQHPGIKQGVEQLSAKRQAAAITFKTELSRLVYEGGGKEQTQTELLRFEDLQLFADEKLDQSIEVARAQQEVTSAVDDSLPALDALISTLLGWSTIQPGLNPLRPEVFVRALQVSLATHVPDAVVREAVLAPAAGLLGVNLRKLYRELTDWLRSAGVEAAAALGGSASRPGARSGISESVSKTMLTLDKLRKLLAGDFDAPSARPDFLYTVPASMGMLQDLDQVDVLVKRLEQRPKPTPPAERPPVDMLAQQESGASPAAQRIGQQLGDEVVRLMFDNLASDSRLLPTFKRQLRVMEPAFQKLAEQDSRFFSDRQHPARQVLDRLTQRSLAFSTETQPGWPLFMKSVESAARWLQSKVIDADVFKELLASLDAQWSGQDEGARQRREEGARALLHAEQRNLLAQKLGAEFVQRVEGLEVADFVIEFLRNSWAQVVAEVQLSCEDGTSDPYGYRALVDDLIWSVQKTTAQRGRARRLVQMIPPMLEKLREGLRRLGYPPELTSRFFDHLITLHRAAVQEGRDEAAQAAAEAAWAEPSQQDGDEAEIWLDAAEAQDSGYVDEGALAPEQVSAPQAPQQEAAAQAEGQAEPQACASGEELRAGCWVELQSKGQWVRAQLTWCSPHASLFMFTALSGSAHSMSRRTLERMRATDQLRIIAERPVVDEALDQVARAALKNSLENKP